MVTKSELEAILQDWSVGELDDGCFEVTRHSPEGEEIVVTLRGDSFKEMYEYAHEYHESFDPEDHAAQIYHVLHYGSDDEKRFFAGAPRTLSRLIEDAKYIEKAIEGVCEALYKEYINGGDDDEGE